MKKYAGAFLSVVILLLLGIMLNSTVLIGQASADRIQIFVNDREIHTDVAPQIIQDRVLIPVRFIATALQAEVEWDEAEHYLSLPAVAAVSIINPEILPTGVFA